MLSTNIYWPNLTKCVSVFDASVNSRDWIETIHRRPDALALEMARSKLRGCARKWCRAMQLEIQTFEEFFRVFLGTFIVDIVP